MGVSRERLLPLISEAKVISRELKKELNEEKIGLEELYENASFISLKKGGREPGVHQWRG